MRKTATLTLALVASCSAPVVQPPSDSGADALAPVDVRDAMAMDARAPGDVPSTGMPDAPADVPGDVPVAVDTCRGTPEAAWLADPRMCLVRFATGLSRPRGLAFAPNGDLFVVTAGSVTVLADADGDGTIAGGERVTFGAIGGLNHGIAFSPDGAWLYVSTPTDVYRWAYARGQRAASSPPERVVRGIPGGGHSTRTLLFDREGRLYVSVGSATNLDQTSSDLALRSMIRRFAIPATLPAGGLAYDAGEVVASGMRNEVGLTIDSSGRMWGVENGRDNLGDARFVGDIHMDNPAEELNRIDGPGPTFFGYPFCWTEGMVTGGGGAGTQHGDVEVTASLRRDDAWCQNAANVRRPAGVMPAHWAPLGVTEYTGSVLPANWRGDLFITSHGSWNREAGQTGRLIARADVQADGTVSGIQPVVGQRDSNGNLVQGVWGVRPVDIRTGPDGALYFTDDLGGRVLRIGYR